MNNLNFDVAKNCLNENEHVLIYKINGTYSAISIVFEKNKCHSKHLGEFSHLVQIPTSWILLSYNWQNDIDNYLVVNEINNIISNLL